MRRFKPRRRSQAAMPFASAQDRAGALAFFAGHDAAHRLFHALLAKAEAWGPIELTATKSRVAITPRTRVIWCHAANNDGSIWLGFLLPRRLQSPRLRSAPAGGRWSHHVKVGSQADLDQELLGWLHEAYAWDAQGIKDTVVKLRRPSQPRDPRRGAKP